MFSPLTIFTLIVIACLFAYRCCSLKEKLAAYSAISFAAVCAMVALPTYWDFIKNF